MHTVVAKTKHNIFFNTLLKKPKRNLGMIFVPSAATVGPFKPTYIHFNSYKYSFSYFLTFFLFTHQSFSFVWSYTLPYFVIYRSFVILYIFCNSFFINIFNKTRKLN